MNALLRTALFLAVAAVVSQLSARLQARESRYRGGYSRRPVRGSSSSRPRPGRSRR
ncbi:hypothetical protein [Methanoculleus chikugoensis]|uniref:hypothetical protein n=1 Tax=Methanoculleus chikugoensis TaxID=118126 RepID=UPI000B3008C4|nr:hypothetical protein [Methanoculleus chikugoensis]